MCICNCVSVSVVSVYISNIYIFWFVLCWGTCGLWHCLSCCTCVKGKKCLACSSAFDSFHNCQLLSTAFEQRYISCSSAFYCYKETDKLSSILHCGVLSRNNYIFSFKCFPSPAFKYCLYFNRVMWWPCKHLCSRGSCMPIPNHSSVTLHEKWRCDNHVNTWRTHTFVVWVTQVSVHSESGDTMITWTWNTFVPEGCACPLSVTWVFILEVMMRWLCEYVTYLMYRDSYMPILSYSSYISHWKWCCDNHVNR